jgi:hypothetical protein
VQPGIFNTVPCAHEHYQPSSNEVPGSALPIQALRIITSGVAIATTARNPGTAFGAVDSGVFVSNVAEPLLQLVDLTHVM